MLRVVFSFLRFVYRTAVIMLVDDSELLRKPDFSYTCMSEYLGG